MSFPPDSKCCDRRKEGPENQHPAKQRLEDIRVGTSAGLTSPLTNLHLSRSTTFLIETTLFSTQGFRSEKRQFHPMIANKPKVDNCTINLFGAIRKPVKFNSIFRRKI
jgi:hypothetical protein